MAIHSLNLNEGGGIIPMNDVSQPENAASVIIGLGGTGVATLKILKKKVYTQLIPSNPGAPVPEYSMIRFLAIDTDSTAVDAPRSDSDLKKDGGEFINIKPANLAALLDPNSPTGRTELKKRPELINWMSIDKIQPLLADDGAGGIRQMGRFMLMESAQRVYNAITSAIHSAMTGNQAGGQVNIHIIAGISGGTGSGTFIDICYLVRRILEDRGWAGKLFGYFFLPDVVIAKPEVRSDANKEHLNRRNGYAAFRELDYLMDLQSANDWFEQSYPGTIPSVKTQAPPVDLAHLISATDAHGNIPAKAFDYSLNVVADYIMAYLAHVDLRGAQAGQDGGLTMQGHLANIVAGVANIQRRTGSNHSYTILGASNAEVPFSQIATYLAKGYYEKVRSISGNIATDNNVNTVAGAVGLTTQEIRRRITRQAPDAGALAAALANINPDDCIGAPIQNGKQHPEAILRPAERWLEAYLARLEDNAKGLSQDLETLAQPEIGQNNSYIALVHSKLMEICRNSDGKGGAKMAAGLLSRTGRTLETVVRGMIEENNRTLEFERNQIQLIENDLINTRDAFMHSNFINRGKRWGNYRNAMVRAFSHDSMLEGLTKIDSVLQKLLRQLTDLYSQFYQKLDMLCDELAETFEQNAAFLGDEDRVASANPYTWRVIELKDVKEDLDAVLRPIQKEVAAEKLMDHLLRYENQSEWLSDSDYRIGRLVTEFMLEQFRPQLSATIEAYIRSKYPGLSDSQIEQKIESDFLDVADEKAAPMFWKVPNYPMNSNTTFASSTMTVPSSSTLITQAADNFQKRTALTGDRNYAVRCTGIGDRIFALRFNSGLPLCAYQGVTLMRADYESDLRNGIVGLHLYEANVALENKANKTEEDLKRIRETAWGSYLPSPIPLSQTHVENEPYTEKEQVVVDLFQQAKEAGVIRKDPNSNAWAIYANNWDGPYAEAKVEDFKTEGAINVGKCQQAVASWQALLDGWTDAGSCRSYPMLANLRIEDGYEDRVLLDTFIRYPRLREVVRSSLEKRAWIEKQVEAVRGFVGSAGSLKKNVNLFTDAISLGFIRQGIGKVVTTGKQYGMDVELRLDKEPEDLGSAFQMFKAFTGFCALQDKTRSEIESQVSKKLDELQEGDDAQAVKLRRQLKNSLESVVTQAQLMTEERRREILDFYKMYQDHLEEFCQQFGDSYVPFGLL